MEPIKLTLTDTGKLTGDVALPPETAEEQTPSAPGARDLTPDEVVWSSDRVDFEGRPLTSNSLFPGGMTSTLGDLGSSS